MSQGRSVCTLSILLCCLTLLSARARADSSVKLRIPIQLGVAAPVGQLAEHTAPLGFAFTASALVGLWRVPVYLGGDLGGAFFLSETTRRRSREFPMLSVETESKPRTLLTHFVVRVQSPWGPIQPYVEGRVGLKHFSTESTVKLVGVHGDELTIEESSTARANALSLGVSLGVEFGGDPNDKAAAAAVETDENTEKRGFWSLSVHYLAGKTAEFAALEVLDPVADTRVSYSFRARTDMLLVMLGVTGDVL